MSKQHDHKELIRRDCERGGLHWKDADRLVTLVESNHPRTIATRQAPLLLFLSTGLLAFKMQILLAFFQQDVLGQILSLQSSYYRILGLITGLGMTVGGLVGLWKAFGEIFPE